MQSPQICGHDGFANKEMAVQGPQKSRDWFLEISERADSTILCVAQHGGYGDIDEVLFTSFSLNFDSPDPVDYKAR